MIERFDNIGISVRDYQAATAFYRKLGFEIESDSDNSGTFKVGDAVLYVFQTTSAQAPVPRDVGLTENAPGIDHISFRVADVDAEFKRLRDQGVAIESEPEDQSWGSRTTTMLDPDGNRIWFLGPLVKTDQ